MTMKILLIEPDRILGRNYCVALEAHGHEVMLRQSAEEAIAAMDENRPELIVLELRAR